MKRYSFAALIWLLVFVACTGAAGLSYAYIDMPLAHYFVGVPLHRHRLSVGLGSAVILSAEAVTVLVLVFVRLLRGRLSPLAETLGVACVASICAYGIDSSALKIFFGVPTPIAVMQGAEHAFHLWMGSKDDSFPSGHMMLASAFAGVFMRLYRTSIWPLSGMLVLAAALLIVGNWHFLSDIIVGTFLGISAGLLAGEAWAARSKSGPAKGT